MVLTFKVSNFRSIYGPAELSCVASGRCTEFNEHLMTIHGTDEKSLKVSVVYGANGAGKSNLYRALRFLVALALDNPVRDGRLDYLPFAFAGEGDEGSVLDLQFCTARAVYRYAVAFSRAEIREERLESRVGENLIELYTRTLDDDGGVIRIGEGLKADLTDKLQAQAVVGTARMRTFLSVVNENLKNGARGEVLADVLEWFKSVVFIGPEARINNLIGPFRDDGFRSFVAGILEQATGVSGLDPATSRMPAEKVASMIPDPNLRDAVSRLSGQFSMHIDSPASGEIELTRGEGAADFLATELKAAHRLSDGRVGYLNVHEESDGTKRLLNLLPAIYRIMTVGGVCVIDELDRSMHALLSRALLRAFLSSNGRGQLIFTTQEDAILDAGYLRRDEVWFAEKDEKQSTRFFSLDDYRVRTRKDPRAYYFEGRYGAIPLEWTLGGRK